MNYRDTTQEGTNLWSVDAIESIDFIQKANIEAFKNATISLIGNAYDPAKVYILWGCVNTGIFPIYDISKGAVFYAGEIFTVNATGAFTPAGVPVGTMTDHPSGTLIKFSDNSTKDILHIRTFIIANGVSGSGTADYLDFVRLNLSYADEVQTDTSNGQTLDVNITAGGPFAYSGLITNYSYRIIGKRCELDFNIVATITDGATVDQIKIPLPAGIVKNTTLNKKYSARGTCAYIAPSSTTDYVACYVNAIDDGTEGQRLVIRRAEGSAGAVTMDVSTSSTLTLKGHICFQIV